MKKLTKVIATVAAAATLTMSFSACGLIKDVKDVNKVKNEKKQAAETKAQLSATVMKLDDSITVNGAYYGYYFSAAKNELQQAASSQNGASGDAAASSDAAPALDLQQVKDLAKEKIIATKTAYKAATDKGIKLTDEDFTNIDASIDQYKQQVKQSGMSFANFLIAMNTNSDTFEQIMKEEYTGKLYLADLVADKYVSAKHILIEAADASADSAADTKKPTKEEALKTITEIKKQLDGGADFDKLMNEKSTDPGLKTSPNGYTFTNGEMVPAFETATMALKVGEISDAVETDYGYHIIKRIETSKSGVAAALANTQSAEVKSIVDAEKAKLAENVKATETDAISFYKV